MKTKPAQYPLHKWVYHAIHQEFKVGDLVGVDVGDGMLITTVTSFLIPKIIGQPGRYTVAGRNTTFTLENLHHVKQ